MQEAAKNKTTPPAPPTSQQNNQTEETSSSHPPQTSSSTYQSQTKFVPRQVQMMPSKPPTRTQETPSSSRNVPLNRTEATKPRENPEEDPPSLLDTLSQINDPEHLQTTKTTATSLNPRPPQDPKKQNKCFIVGGYNAKHQTWSPHSTTNQCGRVLNKFIKNCGFLLSYSSQPTIVPYRTNQRPATIDFGISCGLDNILVETQAELSSDHNPVQFIIPEANNSPYAQNCTTFTNWNRFQELLTTSVPGNPKINNTEEIEANIDQLTNHIHNAINQSSKMKKKNPPFLFGSETSFIAAGRHRHRTGSTSLTSLLEEIPPLTTLRRNFIHSSRQLFDPSRPSSMRETGFVMQLH
ncbi:RNA-directed DNA polymerase from mobile element jockey [Trichonephila clavata]|uniref:RNA-directed DNA polymerase from mobile element jockey n=1 Tax=Trichonephila clavata TaxID=2740835 RepID=A0A8X6KNN7_TRICU|nr:RNA-directed DNA polymerase from mobile element jockey [Trichonephila clavata]